MVDPYRVALWLTVARVFLPNVMTRHQAVSCDAKTPAVLGAARRDSLSRKPAKPGNESDDRLASLAASAPGGFAGAYLESSGSSGASGKTTPHRLIVRLVRPQDREAALKAILPKIREINGGDIDRGGVVVTPARWDLSQLAEWRRYLEPHAHAVAKVVSTEIDQTNNRITYGVATPADRDALVEHLGTLEIPCGLIHVVVPSGKNRT